MACACDGYRILVMFPSPGKSHSILAQGYVRHLTRAGHEVTLVTSFPSNSTNPKMREIDVSDNLITVEGRALKLGRIMKKEYDITDQSLTIDYYGKVAQMSLRNKNVQQLLMDHNEHFDVVIAEWLFDELYSGLGTVFNCPLIWASTFDPHWLILRLIDQPSNPAYVANCKSLNVPPFTLVQRMEELWAFIRVSFAKLFYFNPITEKAYKDIYGPVLAKRGRPLPSYDDVLYNASLVLADSHASLGQATRLPQNYKMIGGYHVETEVKSLPQELRTIMDNAGQGVIYFSMGSKLKSTDMPEELKKRLLKMFGLLKYTVLWKYEEILPDIPENVHILQWAPQQSILAHPNCILFITHGGLLSTTESVHFGKPIIAIPVFGDQYINSKSAAHKGFAKVVELGYDLDKDLKEAIDEVTSNTRYSERAKELSLIYHDRPVPPGAELVHWVEHVVHTRGAPHLRSPALLLPWYQKMYLDALALMMAAVAAVVYVIGKLCSLCKTIVIKDKKYL
ncbi:UDP-glucosyltransferase 2-like [Cydia amplana]|uniref:UDP-glucosyltransferase 2-like n=1 Tax=Cydia amplana TaxID=1869771 RepID=UPI002FE5A00D